MASVRSRRERDHQKLSPPLSLCPTTHLQMRRKKPMRWALGRGSPLSSRMALTNWCTQMDASESEEERGEERAWGACVRTHALLGWPAGGHA